MTRTKGLTITAATAAACLVLAGCGGSSEGGGGGGGGGDAAGGDLPVVTISALPSLGYTSLFLTAEKYDEQFGVDVHIEIASRGDEIFQDVISGQTNLGASTGVQAFNAVDQGLPMKFVAPVNYGFNEDYFMIAAKSKEEAQAIAADPSRLRDQTFAASAPGAMTDISLDSMLKESGVTGGVDDITIQNMPFPEHVSAMASNAVVGSATGEPNATLAEQNGAGFRPYDTPTDPSKRVLIVMLAVNTQWAADNGETMQKFMNAYQAAAQDLEDNGYKSDDAVAASTTYTDLDPELIQSLRLSVLPGDLEINMDNVEAQQDYLLHRDLLAYDEPMDVEDLFDFTWRDAAVKQAGDN